VDRGLVTERDDDQEGAERGGRALRLARRPVLRAVVGHPAAVA
jgi:hypothetical protein